MKLALNILAAVAGQGAVIAFLPVEWQPYGQAAVGIASIILGLFQKSPKEPK